MREDEKELVMEIKKCVGLIRKKAVKTLLEKVQALNKKLEEKQEISRE